MLIHLGWMTKNINRRAWRLLCNENRREWAQWAINELWRLVSPYLSICWAEVELIKKSRPSKCKCKSRRSCPIKLRRVKMLQWAPFLLSYFVLKGAIQDLKLYGMPGVAEVQCDDSFSVCEIIHCSFLLHDLFIQAEILSQRNNLIQK